LKKPFLLLILICWCALSQAFSQNIAINAQNAPLNKLLIELRDKYKINFSFNDELLSKFTVTLNQKFSGPDEAIHSLLNNFPLRYSKQDNIFIILPAKDQKQKKFAISGQIVESGTYETLPYANLVVGDRNITSDVNGNFYFTQSTDSIFHVQATYLGHYVYDTIVPAGNNYRFKLISSSIGLNEILIKGKVADKSLLIGDKAGNLKINNQVSRFLPGNDDNAVFNLLRLMPGILASSEQSNGLIIWGSYEGFSQILFDGFTIWGLKSFSDEINAINPLIIKNMEVLKGGFDASYGDRVGGIVTILGKNGNDSRPSATFNVNNVTMNGLIETPLWHNSSVLLAFRQTYYNQYEKKNLLPPDQEELLNKKLIDYTIYPNYNFRDGNFKFTSKNEKGDLFYISLLGGEDQFRYNLNQTFGPNELSRLQRENNIQTGASAYYSNSWGNGNISSMSIAWSGLTTDYSDIQSLLKNKREFESRNNFTSNSIYEYSANLDHTFSLNKINQIEVGGGFVKNETELYADSSAIRKTSLNEISQRSHTFIQDHISLPGEVNLIIGMRGDYPSNLRKIYLQPRVSASLGLINKVKINMAWGKYNQFIVKSSVIDGSGNYRYIWTTCNNKEVPVLSSTHWVLGGSYKKNNFILSAETYLKNTTGLTKFVNQDQNIRNKVFQGDGRSYGMDLFLRKDYGPHSAWVTYTLSKTEEWFPYLPSHEYVRAPQDQRHELKTGFLLDFKPFSFSANYVFGSGFPLNTGTLLKPVFIEPDYNRLDLSLLYRFKIKSISGETGVSIMNVLDTKNIRYSNFEKIPVDQTNSINIYSEAIPFSPRISLKLSL